MSASGDGVVIVGGGVAKVGGAFVGFGSGGGDGD